MELKGKGKKRKTVSNNLNTTQFACDQRNVKHLLWLVLLTRRKILNDFFAILSQGSSRALFASIEMHNNCSFVFFYCTDCFGRIAGAVLISSPLCPCFVGNHAKLLQDSRARFTSLSQRRDCRYVLALDQFSCDSIDEFPLRRKNCKSYSIRQKLCSRIVVQYQQSVDFAPLIFMLQCNILKPCFCFATANISFVFCKRGE